MILHSESLPVRISITDLDVRDLQVKFGELFDRAADSLYRSGLDLDDVVFDRFMVCQRGDGRVFLEAAWLSNRDRLIAHIDECVAGAGEGDVERVIVELQVRVRREPHAVRTFRVPPPLDSSI